MGKKNLLKPFIRVLSAALGFFFYLLVVSTLLIAWFSPNYTTKIQLASVDLAVKEPFLLLTLAPIIAYGTITTIKNVKREVEK